MLAAMLGSCMTVQPISKDQCVCIIIPFPKCVADLFFFCTRLRVCVSVGMCVSAGAGV